MGSFFSPFFLPMWDLEKWLFTGTPATNHEANVCVFFFLTLGWDPESERRVGQRVGLDPRGGSNKKSVWSEGNENSRIG